MDTDEQKSDTELRLRIHNVRFYNLKPRSIQCLDYNKVWHKLALSRKDASIEIWDMQYAPYLEKIIRQPTESSVEGIAWAGERLFTAGLTGELVEWNLQTLLPRRKQFVTGNAIWCLAVNAEGSELAIGTEEGFINIIDITDDNMQYKKLFDKQEGRVLCCKFDATGKLLVTGSLGAIRVWDVSTGHALQKLTVARAEKKKEVIVWSLQVLKDFTIISGDSRGQITVWDGHSGACVESHQVLKADVLTVVVNEEENLVMCSGIDPIIRIYAKTQIKREDMTFFRWVKYLQRDVHTHDVITLACAGDRIISGGIDGYLGISSMSKVRSTVAKYGPFLQNPSCTVCPESRLLLLRYTDYLEVWRLGSTDGKCSLQISNEIEYETGNKKDHEKEVKKLALTTGPEKLLEFKGKGSIVCASFSSDGKWLCYSTQTEIRLFQFTLAEEGNSKAQLTRIKVLPEEFTVASHIQFSADSKKIFLVNADTNIILIFDIVENDNDLDFTQAVHTSKHIKDVIHLFVVSKCGKYIIAAGTDRTIAVWTASHKHHFKHLLNLPRYNAAVTALAVDEELPRLVAAFADGKIVEYDLKNLRFTCSANDYFVDNAETHCVLNIALSARNPNIFILQNDSNLFTLKKCPRTERSSEPAAKATKKLQSVVSKKDPIDLVLQFQRSYQHIVHLGWLSEEEIVAVSVTPITLIEHLPGALLKKKFAAA